jgi:hypothetical protein
MIYSVWINTCGCGNQIIKTAIATRCRTATAINTKGINQVCGGKDRGYSKERELHFDFLDFFGFGYERCLKED